MQKRKWTEWTNWLALPAVLLFIGATTCAADDGHRALNRVAWAYPVAHAGDGEYWIGVMGAPVDPLLRKHLKIDVGVVIQHVVPDSPADKAGIEEDDILLKFDDEEVGDVTGLAKAIAGNEGKKAKITLLREGEEKTVSVTPAERPDTLPMPPIPHATDLKEFKDWMEKLQKGELGEHPLRLWSMQPGVVIPKDWKGFHVPHPSRRLQLHFHFPKNTSVAISRAEDGPAKIVVKRGGKTWEVTEDELDKLPEDMRRIVDGMLGRRLGLTIPGGGELRLDWNGSRFMHPIPLKPKQLKTIPKEEADKEAEKPAADGDTGAILKRLDEMNKRLREREKEAQREMEKLRQEVERLKKTEV
jgi:membrane-associated protease RseP (regulator of RpoE activity)